MHFINDIFSLRIMLRVVFAVSASRVHLAYLLRILRVAPLATASLGPLIVYKLNSLGHRYIHIFKNMTFYVYIQSWKKNS